MVQGPGAPRGPPADRFRCATLARGRFRAWRATLDDEFSAVDEDEFFDASFLGELEELAGSALRVRAGRDGESPTGLDQKLAAFLAPLPGSERPVDEAAFLEMPPAALAERTNALIDACRESPHTRAVQSVEAFIVFFQALLPTLPEGSREVRRLFFRLAPTLLHIAHNDFGDTAERREEGRQSLRGLETTLLEISSVRLAPSETELVYRSIDQMAALIGVGEYALADEIITNQLLGLIRRNKLTRALYRIMEVEVNVQNYLRERLGYRTPQLRLPEDVDTLSEYGPVSILKETDLEGVDHLYLQVQIPDVPILRDIIVRLVHQETGVNFDLRADALGSVELHVPHGTYQLGLVYEPSEEP